MPIYTYVCVKCGAEVEAVVSLKDRDQSLIHSCCGGVLNRLAQIERTALGKPGYQMQAVLADGSHVKGHFGKEAKRHRKA